MENGPERAAFWKDFILERSGYPCPDRLREQFENAEFTDFCECGCNSFGVKIAAGSATRPLLPPNSKHSSGGHWSIYEAVFRLADEKSLEIIVFADRNGNLAYVEVDCCSNAYPVPSTVEANEPPLHTRSADDLFS